MRLGFLWSEFGKNSMNAFFGEEESQFNIVHHVKRSINQAENIQHAPPITSFIEFDEKNAVIHRFNWFFSALMHTARNSPNKNNEKTAAKYKTVRFDGNS